MMQAFHNDSVIKQKYLERLAAHRAADNLIQGTTWEDGKGCAVGCTLEAYNHAAYETELGIPEMLARLEDTIFEGLPEVEAMQWPERFLRAPRVGADLSLVGWKFLHWLLTQTEFGDFRHEIVRSAVMECAAVIEPLTRGEPVDMAAAESAAESARSVAESAMSAMSARSAAESAMSAMSAAESAAWLARSAARSARSVAESAESAEYAASAAWLAARSAWLAAWSAAQSAAYTTMSNKLIELMEAA